MIRCSAVLFLLFVPSIWGCSKKATTSDSAPAPSSALAAVPPNGASAAPRRDKVPCAKLLPKMEETSKEVRIPMKATPASWGKVPPELRKLPAGAELCGSLDVMGQAIIVSPLFGDELETHYAPLFAALGCVPFKCEVATSDSYVQTRCKCDKKHGFGMVTTDTGNESYALAWVE